MTNQRSNMKQCIQSGQASLGIELGSTRIKAVLIDNHSQTIAIGEHEWDSEYIDGNWTYSLENVWVGLQSCYLDLKQKVKHEFGLVLSSISSLGISAMMHGYLVFDDKGQQLCAFRTWRNNYTLTSSQILTDAFNYPVPQRWSIAHLHNAITNKEIHVQHVNFMTTLAGYVHWQLSGEKVLGVGDASGMFPIDIETGMFNQAMCHTFDQLCSPHQLGWQVSSILPKPLSAGEDAGALSQQGALLLDPEGDLRADIPMCPPEGDAGTGMVATNSTHANTGNVSAGTSIFAMVVLDKPLKRVHPELDLVTTPDGKLVAMAHCNNCSSSIDAWVNMFKEVITISGNSISTAELYRCLYEAALQGDPACEGYIAYGYTSGEHVTHFEQGRPLFARKPDVPLTIANFMRVNLQTALGAVKIGMDILARDEGVVLEKMYGHGGLFKTPVVGQRLMAAALNAPVVVKTTAGEGGAWGIAVLASYLQQYKNGIMLDDFLADSVFIDDDEHTLDPVETDVEGFETFHQRYKSCLGIERAAVDLLP